MTDPPIFQQVAAELPVDIPEQPAIVEPAGPGGLTYSRFVPAAAGKGVLLDVEVHVRAHLSAVADADDDPETSFDDVQIDYQQRPDGVLIVGFLPGAAAVADYLRPGHDPFADVDPDLVREVLGGQI